MAKTRDMAGRNLRWAAWLAGCAASLAPGDDARVAAGLQALDARDAALSAAIAKASASLAAIRIVEPFRGEVDAGPRDLHADAAALVLDAEGRLLTCHHAVRGAIPPANRAVEVFLPTERIWRNARILAADPRSDLAALQVEPLRVDAVGKSVPGGDPAWRPVEFAPGDGPVPGQTVLALGWHFGDLGGNLTPSASVGTVASVRRRAAWAFGERTDGLSAENPSTWAELGGLVQADCRINMGASGGMLADTRGRLAGVIMPLVARVGLETPGGFAVPAGLRTQRVIARLKAGREAEYAFLGISTITPRHGQAVAIDDVVLSRTRSAGLREGDVVESIDGCPVRVWEDLLYAVGTSAPGHVAEVGVRRDGSAAVLRVPLSKAHPPVGAYFTVPRPAWRGVRFEHGSVLVHGSQTRVGLPDGVMVAEVLPRSAAAAAGLAARAMLVAIDGQPVYDPDDCERRLAAARGPVALTVHGRAKPILVKAEPDPPAAPSPKGVP